jgi:glutamate-1-semialdehyde 2,1-aminomutase
MVLDLPYNDIDTLKAAFDAHSSEIAAVIVEGIAGNMGCIPANPEFLKTIQQLCRKHGSLFILDEVMTGFRVAAGGATELYHLDPDLTLLGKVVGGGFPLAVLGGKKAFLDFLAPQGPVYHAGTLSGNPVAVQAGITTLELTQKEDFYPMLDEKTTLFCNAVLQKVSQYVPISAHYVTGMFSFFNTATAPQNLDDVTKQSSEHFNLFFDGLLQEEIYWPASLFESCFLSQAHSVEQLEEAATKVALSWLRASKKLLKKTEEPLAVQTHTL